MDEAVREGLIRAAREEPYSRDLNIEIVKLEPGHSIVEMDYVSETMANIYGIAHGGLIFTLLDVAFETACNAHGTVAMALNINLTYISSPDGDTRLRAEAREMSLTRKTTTFDIKVTDGEGRLIAACQALAYRTGKPIPFV